MTGRTSNDAITLTAVGDVDVRTSSGQIRLEEISEDVSARTSNGEVVGRGARARRGADVQRHDRPREVVPT